MAYGTVKVDNITFDNGGSDQNVTVSGLYRATTSGVTLSGTIAATTVSGVTVIGGTTVSGATVTGTTANFTSGNFSNFISAAATMSGALIIANQQQVRFREAVGNGVNYIALQAPAIVSADQTITLPDQTGTVVTTGDNGSVTSTMIANGTIVNGNINASAGIVDTKLATIATVGKVSNSATTAASANTTSAIVARDGSGNFTAGTITAALTGAASSNVLKAGDTMTGALVHPLGAVGTPSITFTGDLNTGIYSPGADQLAVSTGGAGRLFVDATGNVGIGAAPGAYKFDVQGGGQRILSQGSTSFLEIGNGTATSQTAFIDLTTDTTYTDYGLRFIRDGGGANAVSQLAHRGTGELSLRCLEAAPLTFYTTNTERVRIDSSGRVGIGTASPSELFHVAGSARIGANDTSAAQLEIGAGATGDRNSYVDFISDTTYTDFGLRIIRGSGANGITNLRHRGTGDFLLVTQEAAPLTFATANTERARIDSSGRLFVGTSAALTTFFGTAVDKLAIAGGAAPQVIGCYVNNQFAARLDFVKSRSGTVNGQTVVQLNDTLGEIYFGGSDGTTPIPAARVYAEVDGTPGTNDMPGRLVFSTTADGAASPTERMRITSAGNVGIGTANPSGSLHIESPATTAGWQLRLDSVGLTNESGFYRTAADNYEMVLRNGLGGLSYLTNTGGASTATLEFNVQGSERARIDSSGRLLVGTSTSVSTFGVAPVFQIAGGEAYQSNIAYRADAFAPFISVGHSRSATIGTQTILQSGDDFGTFAFVGSDGTGLIQGARISAAVDGTPGTNDMPGRLVFSTTADGAASPTERLRITSAGVLQIADAGNITVGTTTGTKIGTATTQKLGFYNATPVVQPTAVANATDAASVITQLNALLTRMRNLGLIAT